MDLEAYLAQKYMSGPKAEAILAKKGKHVKKSKKKAPESASLVVVADDDDGFGGEAEEEESFKPEIATDQGTFKGKKSTWQEVQRGMNPKPEKAEPEDDDPVVVEEEQPKTGGLQSAASLKAENERRLRKLAAQKAEAQKIKQQQDTVYRDASGNKIDVHLQKLEEARLAKEKMEKDMERMEWGKGLVQRQEKEARREEAERLRNKPMARYADDEDLNRELKAQDRWNDPAAAFLTKTSNKRASKYPKYAGPPPPPNRFGILPGYRWDGVDRSNGFEHEYMQKINEREVRKAQAYAYSVDDM